MGGSVTIMYAVLNNTVTSVTFLPRTIVLWNSLNIRNLDTDSRGL